MTLALLVLLLSLWREHFQKSLLQDFFSIALFCGDRRHSKSKGILCQIWVTWLVLFWMWRWKDTGADGGPAISLIDRPVCDPRNAGDLDRPECMSNRGRGDGWTGLLFPVCAPSSELQLFHWPSLGSVYLPLVVPDEEECFVLFPVWCESQSLDYDFTWQQGLFKYIS